MASTTRDTRMPSVSPTELEHLDLAISFLDSFQPVTARGEDRIGAVEVGRHGLQIARGPDRGLLLPSVAVDHKLDAAGFLRQVCGQGGIAAQRPGKRTMQSW